MASVWVVPETRRRVEPPARSLAVAAALLLAATLSSGRAHAAPAAAADGGVPVERFGAAGDGKTDDRAAIQAALASGAARVTLSPGKTYVVSWSGAVKTVRGVPQRYALAIPSGVTLDLRGATLKLADGADASVIVNAAAGGRDTDIAIVNGTIDGNGARQGLPASGEIGCVQLDGVTGARVHDLRVVNARQYAGRFLDLTSAELVGLSCSGSEGDCWSFGISGSPPGSLTVRGSRIDRIESENALGRFAGLQGNGAIFTVQDTRVGSVVTRSCAAGIKIQDASARSQFESLTFIGPTNGTNNSGIKVQANVGAGLFPEAIDIAHAESRSAFGAGLYVFGARNLTVGTYVGDGNGNGSYEDVYLRTDGSFHIGRILSSNARHNAVKVLGSPAAFDIDEVVIRNPGGIAFAVHSGGVGRFRVGLLSATDDRAVPSLSTVLKLADPQATGRFERIVTNLGHSRGTPRLLVSGDGPCRATIGAFQQGSDPLEGEVRLTPGGTRTPVENANAFLERTDRAGSKFHPVIAVVPLSPPAARLGLLRATAEEATHAPGFAIEHAPAGEGALARWSIREWRCTPAER
jgi:hypothetical protein